jgi:hypothetical protein
MGVPEADRIMRTRYANTISESARCATICATDQRDGEGDRRSSAALRPAIRVRMAAAVLPSTANGSDPADSPNIRSVYSWNVSVMRLLP